MFLFSKNKNIKFHAKPNTYLEGCINGQGDVRIEGSILGDIHVNGVVIIEKNGNVKGNVIADNVKIRGQVEGNIITSDCLMLFSTGRFYGDARVKDFKSDPGAVFVGNCIIVEDNSAGEYDFVSTTISMPEVNGAEKDEKPINEPIDEKPMDKPIDENNAVVISLEEQDVYDKKDDQDSTTGELEVLKVLESDKISSITTEASAADLICAIKEETLENENDILFDNHVKEYIAEDNNNPKNPEVLKVIEYDKADYIAIESAAPDLVCEIKEEMPVREEIPVPVSENDIILDNLTEEDVTEKDIAENDVAEEDVAEENDNLKSVEVVEAEMPEVSQDTADKLVLPLNGETLDETIGETASETVGESIGETVGETVDETVGGTIDETIDETIGETVDETLKLNHEENLMDKIVNTQADSIKPEEKIIDIPEDKTININDIDIDIDDYTSTVKEQKKFTIIRFS